MSYPYNSRIQHKAHSPQFFWPTPLIWHRPIIVFLTLTPISSPEHKGPHFETLFNHLLEVQ